MNRCALSVGAVVVLVLAAGCGSPTATANAVTVGVLPVVDVAPIYLGRAKGFFAARKIDLTLETAKAGQAMIPGVLDGHFHFGFCPVTTLMAARTRNVAVKGVVNGAASTGKEGADFGALVVAKDSPIRSARALADRRIAVTALKGLGDVSVRESVRKAGGDPATIDFVATDAPQAELEQGKVDAAWLVEPSLSAVKAKGGRVVASAFVDVAKNLTVGLYFTSAKLLDSDPDLVRRFTDGMLESLAYADAHPEEVRQALTGYLRIDDATLEAMTLPRWPIVPDRPSLERLAALGKKDGLFTTTPNLDDLLP
ncbi:ABC transporter substrate-binding protein [Nonomuraea sp. NPDC050556]|uniref:ABC transporter substrate-binding protein n=1 Tax=Nonomuraea sp. NPDC050556 TaxID=3364369 RepID=UPI003794A10F